MIYDPVDLSNDPFHFQSCPTSGPSLPPFLYSFLPSSHLSVLTSDHFNFEYFQTEGRTHNFSTKVVYLNLSKTAGTAHVVVAPTC